MRTIHSCKDEHVVLPHCSDCEEIDARLTAVEECCEDAHEDINGLDEEMTSLDNTKASIEYVNESVGGVESDIENLETRLNNVIIENGVTENLWTGETGTKNELLNLSDGFNNYDYLYIYYNLYGVNVSQECVRIPASYLSSHTVYLQGTFHVGNQIYNDEISIVKVTNSQLKIADNEYWNWNGNNTQDASHNTTNSFGKLVRIDGIKAASSNTPSEVIDARTDANNVTHASLKARCDSDYTELKEDLQKKYNNIVLRSNNLNDYFYKADTYINSSGQETYVAGADTYKIPCKTGDFILLKQTSGNDTFYNGLTRTYVYNIMQNGSISQLSTSGNNPYYTWGLSTTNHSEFGMFVPSSITYLYVTVRHGNEGYLTLNINNYAQLLNEADTIRQKQTIYNVNADNSMVSGVYRNLGNVMYISTAGYTVRIVPLKVGDKIVIPQKTTGITYWGYFAYIDDGAFVSEQMEQNYTALHDGFAQVFNYSGDNITITVYPKDSIMLDWVNIKNKPANTNPFDGLKAVAFGTSLTYRAISNDGYLDYLPDLSGITFDNQGIGSSYIQGNMLTAIKNYASYADKDICTIEGFVNDWYYKVLGTFTDTTEDTACGCLRSAINYIYSQKTNITIFVILDHYGKQYSTLDCRSTAVNSYSQTQKYYYDELAKVAESMGVPVIKLYEMSQISENTPTYLTDNIHPTALGAKQTAYAIWSRMKDYYPNRIL